MFINKSSEQKLLHKKYTFVSPVLSLSDAVYMKDLWIYIYIYTYTVYISYGGLHCKDIQSLQDLNIHLLYKTVDIMAAMNSEDLYSISTHTIEL